MNGDIFETVHFGLSQWAYPYGNQRYFKQSKEKGQCHTIYCGSTQRFQWYIVMFDQSVKHPTNRPIALRANRFVEFISLVLHVFETVPALYKYGINTVTFGNGSKNSWDLECRHWILLQEEIFKRWKTFFTRSKCWTYWKDISVAIHMFDFGGNNTIVLSSDGDAIYDTGYVQASLERITEMANIERITFALATEVRVRFEGPGETNRRLALVGDSEMIREQYTTGKNNLRIFPIGFASSICNFQSDQSPKCYKEAVFERLRNQIRDHTLLEDEIISFESFQGYSTLKQQIRPSEMNFKLGHSIYTGVYCIPNLSGGLRFHKKWEQLTSEANHHLPLQQIIQAVNITQQNEMSGYRFEPVISIDLTRLDKKIPMTAFLVKDIILPVLCLWDIEGQSMCHQLLRCYDYEVS